MFRYEFRCQSCNLVIECLREHTDIYAPTCECGAPPGGMKRVYSSPSFHRKPDPNFERDRAVLQSQLANGNVPISKREADMLEHNVNAINKQKKEEQDRKWEAAIDKTLQKVGGF